MNLCEIVFNSMQSNEVQTALNRASKDINNSIALFVDLNNYEFHVAVNNSAIHWYKERFTLIGASYRYSRKF